MTNSSKHLGRLLGGLGCAVALAGWVADARAACPDPSDVCECLGEAAQFAVVGPTLKISSGRISASGYGYAVPVEVETSVCGTTGKLTGKVDGEVSIHEDLLFSAASGVAAKFKGTKAYGYPYPGIFVDGDLATAGGTLVGLEAFGVVAGTTDTMAGNPRVSECAQAQLDQLTASAALAALPATQSFPKTIVKNGATLDLNAGSGVVVYQFDDLILTPEKIYGTPYASVLAVNLALDTDTVIINVTGKFSVGAACEVLVNGGDIEDVIINVPGATPSVKVKSDAVVQPAILAPGRKLLTGANAYTANLYAGSLKLKGSNVYEPLLCP
jgi:choice-of-anchor A domain-containing protein